MMNQVTQSHGLIKPFNLDPTEYAAMYNAALPDRIDMTVNVLKASTKCPHCAVEYLEQRRKKLDDALLECVNRASAFGIDSMVAPVPISDSGLDCLWSLFAAKQDAWQIEDGLYIQAAFSDFDLIGQKGPRLAVAYPMTLLDTLVCRTGSVDPARHSSQTVCSDCSVAYEDEVGDTFRHHLGIWTKQLVEFRSMALVYARAALTDRDPATEYDRFVNSGGWYFLEYPGLCP
jgi:hypothetical protein